MMKQHRVLGSLIAMVLMITGIVVLGATPTQAAKNITKGLTTEKPLKYNKSTKEIAILTQVNGTYFTQATRHVIVNVDGSNGDKSLLKTDATPKAFNDALKKVGAKAGNNLTKKSAAGTKVKGSKLGVYFVINGKRVKAEKAVQVNKKDVSNLDFRFGGNMAMNNEMKTGCVLCFDSCPVGIASGAKYGFQYGEHFTGKDNVLPKDGSNMVVVFKVK
ncbi:YdjY domain-containing protein [Loigolactobacillus jiayinensis]|uniref:YdjY domain-containing protein n=1 Tax=Loigolactobacillus jiayinensis TaxID=2486016 RepID=A0ABW1RFW1_9LACO|nr:YdjY domain-containing protein [Loigolactobacillus jiayinensis]